MNRQYENVAKIGCLRSYYMYLEIESSVSVIYCLLVESNCQLTTSVLRHRVGAVIIQSFRAEIWTEVQLQCRPAIHDS